MDKILNNKLINEIKRIKSLLLENSDNTTFTYDGDINSSGGFKINLIDNDHLGEVSLINFEDAWDLDYAIVKFHHEKDNNCKFGCSDNFFNKDNSIYLYSLEVNPIYRSKGYGKKLLTKCHEMVKNLGFSYILLITDCNNHVAQDMYKKFGYNIHQTDGIKDFYYTKLD